MLALGRVVFRFCWARLKSRLCLAAASVVQGMQPRLCAISLAPGSAHHLLCSDAARGSLSFVPLWVYAVFALIHVWPYLPFWFTEQVEQQCLRIRYYACLHGYVQRLRCGMLLRQLVHWFMRPYLAVYQRETRQEVIRRAHKAGVFLKSSTLKHQLLTPRQQTQSIRRQNPVVPTSCHLRLLTIITFLLSASTVAAAGGTGHSGFAAAATSMDAAQLVSTNLHHYALMDPGNAFELLHMHRQATPASPAFLRNPVVPRSLKRTSPDHPFHGVWLQEQARAAKRAQARAPGSADDGQAPPGSSEQANVTVDDFSPEGKVSIDPTLKYWTDPDNQWVIGNHPGLTPAIREQLQAELLGRRDSCFAYRMSDLTGYTGEKFVIKLKHDRPIMQKPRKHAPLEMDIQDTKCVELHEAGFIVASSKNCQYASNATMPAKKDADGNWTDFRFCLDYRNINEATVADHYGMHLPEQLFACVAGSTFFSKIDLRGAFHQILIDEDSQQYTSFFWRNQQFNYTRLPYGMRNGPAELQRIMDREIGAAGLRDVCTCFIDDLLVHSQTAEEHLSHVCAVLDMLKACGLRAHPAKSCFFADTVEYLGHYIGANGLTPHQAKIAAVAGLRVPTNVSELRSVLGFLNYYRCYVQNFSAIAAPLNRLLGDAVPWQWTSTEHDAYQALKDAMCREGAALKHFDRDRPAIVYTDWSSAGVAAVLAQVDDDGNEYMVACAAL
jgi:Reverse transcriptase (RNA-dependent DNA polymerase)/RNase H-like domain found in reverse transcriptase